MRKKVVINIRKLLENNGNMSLSELSDITGVRRAALSELVNGKRERVNFSHIERIAEALNINDINDILSIVNED